MNILKRNGLLNVPLCSALANIGHGDILMIVDAGYPIPAAANRVDLSILAGVPDLETVYAAIAPELIVEKVHFAHEVRLHNHPMYTRLTKWFDERDFEPVEHATVINDLGNRAKFIVRTGALDPWGNIALVGGVDYAAYFSDPAISVPENFRALINRRKFVPGAGLL